MSRTTATGYVDPSLMPAKSAQEQAIFDLVLHKGLALHRLHVDRKTVRVVGPGVFIVAEGLWLIKPRDLTPFNGEVVRGQS